MTVYSLRRAVALATLLPVAAPAPADTTYSINPDSHAPAGVMLDHTHHKGDVMVGLTIMHDNFGGANRSGTAPISDAAIAAAGYTARTRSMTMDMAMLHLMWAPTDRTTLFAMPSWTRMHMTMIGLPPAAGVTPHSHGGHALAPGDRASHVTSGVGDTLTGAMITLVRGPKLSAHTTFAVSIPTGSVDRRGDDGVFLHYGMQSGSGTWDLAPSLTVRGQAGLVGWGAQTGYLVRGEKTNVSGFRFGDRFTATAWSSLRASSALSLSGRLAYSDEGIVKGHYNTTHNHDAPADRQANYGGQRIEAGIGANLIVLSSWRCGGEVMVPVYQRLNGIQAPKSFGLNLSISRAF